MRPCSRGPAPEPLLSHGEEWSREFAEKRAADPACRFNWKSYAGTPVNRTILSTLRAMTSGHCAYCDGFPLDVVSDPTIDHFRPKSDFPELAYIWTNLYLSCEKCQSEKTDLFEEALLRPDEGGYAFSRYFVYQEKSGELSPHPGAPLEDQRRAETTLRLLGLNRGGRPVARRRELQRFLRLPVEERREQFDSCPYRFLLESEM